MANQEYLKKKEAVSYNKEEHDGKIINMKLPNFELS